MLLSQKKAQDGGAALGICVLYRCIRSEELRSEHDIVGIDFRDSSQTHTYIANSVCVDERKCMELCVSAAADGAGIDGASGYCFRNWGNHGGNCVWRQLAIR